MNVEEGISSKCRKMERSFEI